MPFMSTDLSLYFSEMHNFFCKIQQKLFRKKLKSAIKYAVCVDYCKILKE